MLERHAEHRFESVWNAPMLIDATPLTRNERLPVVAKLLNHRGDPGAEKAAAVVLAMDITVYQAFF